MISKERDGDRDGERDGGEGKFRIFYRLYIYM